MTNYFVNFMLKHRPKPKKRGEMKRKKLRKSGWKEIKVLDNKKFSDKVFRTYAAVAKELKNGQFVTISVCDCTEYIDGGKIKTMRIFMGRGEIRVEKGSYSYPTKIGLMIGAL